MKFSIFLLVSLIFCALGYSQNLTQSGSIYADAINRYKDTLHLATDAPFYLGDMNPKVEFLFDKKGMQNFHFIDIDEVKKISADKGIQLYILRPIKIDGKYIIVPISSYAVKSTKKNVSFLKIEDYYCYYFFDADKKEWINEKVILQSL